MNKNKWHVRLVDGIPSALVYGLLPKSDYIEYPDKESAEQAHPKYKESRERHEKYGRPIAELDKTAGPIAIAVAHLAKALEAERVIFDGETNLDRLPHLAAVADGAELLVSAQGIWDKYLADAARENARVRGKKRVRGDRGK